MGNGRSARSFEILGDYPGKIQSEFILNRLIIQRSAVHLCDRSVDVHEESYLPFLFADKSADDKDIDGASKKAAGRRIFNKKGEEVSMKVCSRYFS